MVEAGGVSELRLSLKGSGALELSATRAADPAAGSKPLLGLSRKALDDRNDFMALSSDAFEPHSPNLLIIILFRGDFKLGKLFFRQAPVQQLFRIICGAQPAAERTAI